MREKQKNKNDLPKHWYNVAADFKNIYVPSLNPITKNNLIISDITNIFPDTLAKQEFDTDNVMINIPDELLELYRIWRPTPLFRAKNLENYLKTKCKIFYKYEGVSPIGSHKANSAIAQAYYAKKSGFNHLVGETGAGQWGSAISMAASFNNMMCSIFMVKNSYESKAARRILMQTFGSTVISSPSDITKCGSDIKKQNEGFHGSLGLAIAEAVEYASNHPNVAYSLGSALNFVCLHQTIIGNELMNQLKAINITPNYIICCVGGGSSFAGISFPFLREKLEGKNNINFIAAESNAVPTITRGKYTYDHGDSAKLTPLMKMYTLGHDFAAPAIHAGGLRYHGLSPLISKMCAEGYVEGRAYSQLDVYNAATIFTKCEGFLPAPEAAHGIKSAIDVAVEHQNEQFNIIFCLTGHGFFDLGGYEAYNLEKMEDSVTPSEIIV